MPVFEYRAVTNEGAIERGTLLGETLDDAAKRLTERGLKVEQLGLATSANDPINQELSAAPRERSDFEKKVVGGLAGAPPLHEMQFFFKQLGTMLNAGINPAQALTSLSSQAKKPKLRMIIGEMAEAANRGETISSVMRRHPDVFNEVLLAMIMIGETSGVLSDQCHLVSQYLRREIELRNIIRRETFMPKATLVVAIVIIIIANFVIATYGKPDSMQISSPLTNPVTWIFLAPILIAIILFFRVGLKFENIATWWDRVIITLPGFRGVFQGFAMASFCQVYAVLYRAGVPLHSGLELAAVASGNRDVAQRLLPAVEPLKHGESLTTSLAHTGAVSQIILDMTDTGERTGDLDEMLEKCAEFYEDESITKAKQLSAIVGVITLIIVGIYVLYVLFTFYTGYFGSRMDLLDQ